MPSGAASYRATRTVDQRETRTVGQREEMVSNNFNGSGTVGGRGKRHTQEALPADIPRVPRRDMFSA